MLISVMTANNEIGTLQPVTEIGRLVRELRTSGRKIWFHTDAVQAVGKTSVDVEEIGCDLLSLSGHKIYAPKGIGALYIRRGTRIHAQNLGGRQERSLRGGTESVPLDRGSRSGCRTGGEGVQDRRRDGSAASATGSRARSPKGLTTSSSTATANGGCRISQISPFAVSRAKAC